MLVPPTGLSVMRPSVTATTRVAVANFEPVVGVKAAIAFWFSTLTQCELSIAVPASPTSTLTE